MKKFTSFCLAVVAMMLLATPQAWAIITDPDDYIIWDSGAFADSTKHASFVIPDFMLWSPGVELTTEVKEGTSFTIGRNFGEEYGEDFGFAPGVDPSGAIGVLHIKQRKDDDATANGERFSLDYAGYLGLKGAEKLLPWTYSKANNMFYRPSDSIVIRVPKTCDSIYIQGLGTNNYYSLMAYEVGVSEFVACEKGVFHGLGGINRTNVYHQGGNWGAVRSLGFKPHHTGPGDSTTIVILGAHKDYFGDNKNGDLTHFCKDGKAVKDKQIYSGETITEEDGTVRDRYVSSERWGMWEGTTINRIKVFGTIEKGEVPEYDGTHSAFTFSYQTKKSGTVELDKPLKKEDGWNSTPFVRYASDLGVVRSVLSASAYIYLGYDKDFGSYATKLNVINETPASTFYDSVAYHANYFELKVPTTNFQDLTMDFDYAVRGSNNQLIVAAYINGDKACTLLDTLDNSADPNKTMAHASITIPNEFANQKNFMIRIMLGKGALSGTAEVNLANLTFKGYNDYYPSADGAPKVAYLTPAADRVHVMKLSDGPDAADVVLPYLFENENANVSVITKDMWSEFTSDDATLKALEGYDVVVASPYMTAEDLSFAQALIGKKPFLNFNAQAFMNWNANATSSADAADTAMVYAEEFYYHPIFANIDLDEEKMMVPNFFGANAANIKVPEAEGTYVLAAANNSGAAAVYEDYSNPKAKYIFVDMPAENSNNLNDNGENLIINAISYLHKSGEFVKPTFELNAQGAVVENSAQFTLAANYDYGVLNLKTPVIKMKTSTDADGVYSIAEGFGFGGNNITIQRNSADDNVIIVGDLTDAEELNATHLTFKNITFKPAADQAAIITLKAGDRVHEELRFENCTFEGVKNAFVALSGDSIDVKTITLQNCLFDGVDVASLIKVDGDVINCNKVAVNENRFYDLKAAALLDWQTQATKEIDDVENDNDEILSVGISNNTFRNTAAATAEHALLNMQTLQYFDKADIKVNNNIFYNMGDVKVVLFAAPAQQIFVSQETLKDVNGNDSIATVSDTIDFVGTLNLNKNFVEGSSFTLTVVAEQNAAAWDTTYFVGVNKDSLALDKVFDDEALTQISKLSPMFTGGIESGLSRAYLGAAANYVSRHAGDETVFTVKTAQELKTALELSIGGDIIELENNTEDSLGVYQIGQSGFTYPSTGGKLIIRAAEGHNPVLFGNMAPSNASLNLDELLIDGLTWADPTVQDETRISGYNAELSSPFYFQAKDGYIGLFHITNSAFLNLQMQSAIRANKCYDEGAKTGLTIGKIVMDYNEFNNFGGALEDGKLGYHFVQFDVKGSYTINNFEFIENVVKNFHGSQMFNITREGALNPADSTINIRISNNVFYKIGGNANDKYRNFLEFNKAPVGYEVNIDITNNIFWKRWSDVNYPNGQLDLFDGSQVKAYSINVLKNFYEGEYYSGDETNGANPMAPTDSSKDNNLMLSANSNVEVNRDVALDWFDFNDWIELDESSEDFTNNIPVEYEVYTAGVEHPYNAEYKYIGAGLCYGVSPSRPVAIESVETADFSVFANNGKLFINAAEKAQVEIYHISGKKVATQALNAGLNEIGSLSNGMYILNIDGRMAKVMVK